MDRQKKRPLNIIVDLLFAMPYQMLGHTRVKRIEEKAGSDLGIVLLTYAFT